MVQIVASRYFISSYHHCLDWGKETQLGEWVKILFFYRAVDRGVFGGSMKLSKEHFYLLLSTWRSLTNPKGRLFSEKQMVSMVTIM